MSSESKLALLSRARRIKRQFVVYSLDLAAFALSTILAFELRFDGALPAQYFHPMAAALCIWAGAKSLSFIVGRVSLGSWRHASANDAIHIVLANSTGAILGGLIIFFLIGSWGVPRSVYILDWLISCLLTLGGRLTVRAVLTSKSRSRIQGERTKILIYGAGAAGVALLWELLQNQSLRLDVYNESAYRYERGKRARAYLNDAGGPTRSADQKRAFVIRADGSVVSRQNENSYTHGNFDKLILLPGDALVVPEKLTSSFNMQALSNWAQLASSTALTAASLSILK